MFSVTEISRSVQQLICLALSVVVVSASLSLGAFGAQSAAQPAYSVTITQLQ